MTGLPPTLITAGIPTELHVYPGLTHAQKPGAYVVNQMKEVRLKALRRGFYS